MSFLYWRSKYSSFSSMISSKLCSLITVLGNFLIKQVILSGAALVKFQLVGYSTPHRFASLSSHNCHLCLHLRASPRVLCLKILQKSCCFAHTTWKKMYNVNFVLVLGCCEGVAWRFTIIMWACFFMFFLEVCKRLDELILGAVDRVSLLEETIYVVFLGFGGGVFLSVNGVLQDFWVVHRAPAH